MFEEIVDVGEHWSYTIMGNWMAGRYYEALLRICFSKITSEDRSKADASERSVIKRELVKNILEGAIDELFLFVKSQRSRLAYFVFGVLLMRYGAKISNETRFEILEYTKWDYESSQFKTEDEKNLRRCFLQEFRQKLSKHKEGVYTEVAHETLRDIYTNHGPFNLTPIKYKI